MTLIHEGTPKNENGTYTVIVLINGVKRYEYLFGTDHHISTFMFLYRKRFYGKALNILRKYGVLC